jgi:hypothetical protein
MDAGTILRAAGTGLPMSNRARWGSLDDRPHVLCFCAMGSNCAAARADKDHSS